MVKASPEKVFAVATDFANAASRIKGIKKLEVLTQGPVGLGTRFRETRVMFGKEASETMEVTAFDPPRSYTLSAASHGCSYLSTVSVAPEGAGSRLSMTFAGTPLTVGAKVMSALMGWMIVGSCRKAMQQDLADIGAAAESA